ncbi:MAG: PilN domain-containing protein [Alphaproteobacteria bacterium]
MSFISSEWIENLSRADFLTSIGLYVTPDRLVLVRLRKSFLNLALAAQETRELPLGEDRQAISELTGWIAEDVREIALKAEGESRDRPLKEAIVSLLPQLNAARDSIYICVPQEFAIVRQLYFPLAAEANLGQALEYEIERQLPFRRDELFYDFLPAGRKGDKIGVYLFAIPKSHLMGLLDILASLGIKPAGVETTVTALANYLLSCKRGMTDSVAVIGAHQHSVEIFGVQALSNGWRPACQLLYTHWLPDSDWAENAGRELLRESIAAASKVYGWGEMGEFLQSGAGEPVAYDDLMALAGERLKGGEAITQAHALPALGAALGGLRETFLTTNLLKGGRLATGRVKVLSLVNAILMCLLALSLIAWGVSYPIRDELRLRQLRAENQKLEPAVAVLRGEEAELQKARKELTFLSGLDQRKGEVLRVLDELTRVIPTNAYLSNLRYHDRVIELQGNAESASALIPVLERSPVFENVGFNAPSNRGRDNRETFSLKAEIEKPKQGKAAKP